MIDKNAWGYLSLFFVVLGSIPYISSVLVRKTKPHIFTRIIWSFTTATAAAAQYSSNAGPGAWAASLGALFCIATTILSFKYGELTITRSDWIAFMIGLAAIPLWYFTSNPLPAVILVTLIDASAYYPTFRKSYIKPQEEMIFLYTVSNFKHIASVVAITQYSTTTLFYPVILFIMNSALISMLAWRRTRMTSYD